MQCEALPAVLLQVGPGVDDTKDSFSALELPRSIQNRAWVGHSPLFSSGPRRAEPVNNGGMIGPEQGYASNARSSATP